MLRSWIVFGLTFFLCKEGEAISFGGIAQQTHVALTYFAFAFMCESTRAKIDEEDHQLRRRAQPLSNDCAKISVLSCDDILRSGDFVFEFDGSDGGLMDKNGNGIGFTMVDPPESSRNPSSNPVAPGYWPELLEVDKNTLVISPAPGIQFKESNDLDNALGVGLNLPSKRIVMSTVLTDLPRAPGGYAQAGLWYGSGSDFGRGTSEDDYIKLVIMSPSAGTYAINTFREQEGQPNGQKTVTLNDTPSSVMLKLVIDPQTKSAEAVVKIEDDEFQLHEFSNLPLEWLSFDQAGIDAKVMTRSYGGVFATSRSVVTPLSYRFDSFMVTEETPTYTQESPPPAGDFNFDRWSISVKKPTALAWGPDEQLYVSEVNGKFHAISLDFENQIAKKQTFNSLRYRLLLGLAVDPKSTSEKVILWVAHSDGSQNNGKVNSGIVSRLEGPSFSNVEDVIVGLPRAVANHAMNNIKFGPDGKLYLAMGGNTGAGAANNAESEFYDRPEQPLSAAVVVADVNSPTFKGECATPLGQFGIPEMCDVEVYASGLRNTYDIAWHSNGQLYAADNGLGVTGTVPPKTSTPCTGMANPYKHNPGEQSDLIHRLQKGKYYGHPNPYRNECVFKDGSFQGVAPLSNYEPPLFSLGPHWSANGILEYKGDRFFSKLMGELMILNYSKGDNMSRTRLSPDGKQVVFHGSLVEGFKNPLPIEQDPSGRLYVGEYQANQVTVLDPKPLYPEPVGAWSQRSDAPMAIHDAGSSTIDGKLFMVGGKTSKPKHLNTLFIYDPVEDSWTSGAPFPGEAVENPAVAAFDGKLYAFGGSTGPFSGASKNAAVYDPAQDAWTSLP